MGPGAIALTRTPRGADRGNVHDRGIRSFDMAPKQFANAEPGSGHIDAKMSLEFVNAGVDDHVAGANTGTVDQASHRAGRIEECGP